MVQMFEIKIRYSLSIYLFCFLFELIQKIQSLFLIIFEGSELEGRLIAFIQIPGFLELDKLLLLVEYSCLAPVELFSAGNYRIE
jgi:hypothetical protein